MTTVCAWNKGANNPGGPCAARLFGDRDDETRGGDRWLAKPLQMWVPANSLNQWRADPQKSVRGVPMPARAQAPSRRDILAY